MFKIRLRFILESKGIPNPYNFMIKNGFTPNIATRYINGIMDTMNLAYLEKLCLILQCTPHDLLEWVPPKDVKVTDEHPLHPLIRHEKPYDIISHINQLPFDKVKHVQEYIEQLKNGEEK